MSTLLVGWKLIYNEEEKTHLFWWWTGPSGLSHWEQNVENKSEADLSTFPVYESAAVEIIKANSWLVCHLGPWIRYIKSAFLNEVGMEITGSYRVSEIITSWTFTPKLKSSHRAELRKHTQTCLHTIQSLWFPYAPLPIRLKYRTSLRLFAQHKPQRRVTLSCPQAFHSLPNPLHGWDDPACSCICHRLRMRTVAGEARYALPSVWSTYMQPIGLLSHVFLPFNLVFSLQQ